MLNVPTLWTVFVVNFSALGLIWAYVTRSYPKFEAARFWMASAFVGAAGAMTALIRLFVDLSRAASVRVRRHHRGELSRRDGHPALL